MRIRDRKIVIVNQAANYLTIGLCNEFYEAFENVALVTGGVHEQGEELSDGIDVQYINKWHEQHGIRKVVIYLTALSRILLLLRTRFRWHEVLFVSVPPMAYLLNLLVPNRCSMIIWDVYPDIFKITGMKEDHPFYRFWRRLNCSSFRRAYRIFTIGDKVAEALAQYTSRDRIIVHPIWSVFRAGKRVAREANPFSREHGLHGKFVVQYSGNIGVTHRVEMVVQLAKKMQDHPEILFQIIGRGPRAVELKRAVEESGLENCQFLPFQSDQMFPYSLAAADLGVVILDELASKGSVPSKSYNLMSFGIPSLYIASPESELQSYADRFGHAVCVSGNELDAAVEFILELNQNRERYAEMAENSLAAAVNFQRGNAKRFVESYLNPRASTG